MRAAMLEADNLLTVREVDRDMITEPHQVLLQVKSCAVCATDLKWYTGLRPPPWEKPSRFGHEVAGIVAQVGPAVTGWRPGDRVFSRIVHGGFAEHCLADGRMLAVLPEPVGFEEGAIAQLLPIAVSAAEKSIKPGDTVYVSGAGAAGLLVIQVARAYGAERVIAGDIVDWRLQRARELGATHAVNVADLDDVAHAVRAIAGGDGPDVAAECVGTEPSYRACERSVRHDGTVTIFGSILTPVSVDFMYWEAHSLNVNACREATPEQYVHCLRRATELLASGEVQLKPLLTHTRLLDEVQEAFQYCLTHRADVIKMAIVP